MTASCHDSTVYVIGTFDGGLVVLPLRRAQRLAVLNDALEQSSTWSDFLQSITEDEATLSYVADQYDELPDPEEPFDPDEIPGFAEGIWPPFPKASFNRLPHAVITLGAIRPTAFDGDLFQIDEEHRPEVIAALARLGMSCIQDDDLIQRACGGWRYG